MIRRAGVLFLLTFTAWTAFAQVGGSPSSPYNLAATSRALFFNAFADADAALFVSDGTAAGTRILRDANGDRVGPAQSMFVDGDILYFASRSNLYRSDGSDSGTRRITSLPGGIAAVMGVAGSHLVYTDNTDLFSIQEGSAPVPLGVARDGNAVVWNDILYFIGSDSSARAVWRTDGTVEGTFALHATAPFGAWLVRMGDALYYTAANDLWRVERDGAATLVATLQMPFGETQSLVVAADRVWVAGHSRVWVSDGTTAGTKVAFDGGVLSIAGAPGGILISGIQSGVWTVHPETLHATLLAEHVIAHRPVPLGSRTLFQGWRDNDVELWRTDFTTDGTTIVREINPRGSGAVDWLTTFRGETFFGATDGVHGAELWKSDGTASGTQMLVNLRDEAAIEGRVLDDATSEPIPGVIVEAYVLHGVRYVLASTAVTDPTGAFRVEGLLNAEYVLRTRDTGAWVSEVWPDRPCPSCPLAAGTPVRTVVPSTTGGVEMRLARGSRISGSVRALGGTPLAGLTVEIETADGEFAATARSQADGTWIAHAVPSGTYFARVTHDSGFAEQRTLRPIAVRAPEPSVGVDLVLTALGRIRGVITDAVSGDRVAQRVVVYGTDRSVVMTRWAANGEFELVVPDGLYTIAAGADPWYPWERWIPRVWPTTDCPGGVLASCSGVPIVVRAGQTVIADFALTRNASAATIRGRITNGRTGAPVGSATIVLYGNAPGTSSASYSAADGTYQALGSTCDSCVLVISSRGYIARQMPVVLLGGTTSTVDVALEPESVLTVVLRDGSGAPVQADVTVSDQSFVALRGRTDAAGKLSGSVRPGTYTIHVHDSAVVAVETTIVVSSTGESIELPIIVRRYPSLRGRVTSAATGHPIRNARVEVVGTLQLPPASTKGDGSYAFTASASGHVFVHVSAPGYESQTQQVSLRFDVTVAADFVLVREAEPAVAFHGGEVR